MNNFFESIASKLKKEIKIENLEIVDNSQKHKKHKFFSPQKLHLHLKIKSNYLNSLSRINAQKKLCKFSKMNSKLKFMH